VNSNKVLGQSLHDDAIGFVTWRLRNACSRRRRRFSGPSGCCALVLLLLQVHSTYRAARRPSLNLRRPRIGIPSLPLKVHIRGHDDADYDPKESQRASEDLNDENLDKERRVSGVSQRARASHDADAYSARQVGKSHGQPARERGVSTGHHALRVGAICVARHVLDFGLEDDRHDDSVDGDRLAEDDGYEILAGDARSGDRPARQRAPRDENTPGTTRTGREEEEDVSIFYASADRDL